MFYSLDLFNAAALLGAWWEAGAEESHVLNEAVVFGGPAQHTVHQTGLFSCVWSHFCQSYILPANSFTDTCTHTCTEVWAGWADCHLIGSSKQLCVVIHHLFENEESHYRCNPEEATCAAATVCFCTQPLKFSNDSNLLWSNSDFLQLELCRQPVTWFW